jgi:hypothetical protein
MGKTRRRAGPLRQPVGDRRRAHRRAGDLFWRRSRRCPRVG